MEHQITTSIRLPRAILDRLQALAVQMGMTRTNLIRNVLTDYVRQQKKQEKKK